MSDKCAALYLHQWGLICGYNRGEDGVGWRLTSRGLAVLGFHSSIAKIWRVKRGTSGFIAVLGASSFEEPTEMERIQVGNTLADVRMRVMDWFKEHKLPCLCVPAQPDAPDGLVESWM